MKVAPKDRILRLAELAFVTMVEVSGSHVVTVHPPLLVEHFRHEALPVQRATLLAHIDASLSADAYLDEEVPQVGLETAAYVRLAHERARLRTLRAREAWRRSLDLESATEFLTSLGEDNGHASDELDALIESAGQLPGTLEERAEWEIAYAVYTAFHLGQPREAVERLRECASRLGMQAIRVQAEADIIEIWTTAVRDEAPFAGRDIASFTAGNAASVRLARAHWLLARGRVTEADAMLRDAARGDPRDPRLDVLIVYTQLELGDLEAARRLAEDRLAEARAAFDASRLRLYAFLTAVVAVAARRFDDAEGMLKGALSLGLPPGASPLSYVGLTIFKAGFAALHGQRSRLRHSLLDLEATGLCDGPLPGQQRDLVTATLAFLDGETVRGAELCRQVGDTLWERGARLAAAHAYLEGVLRRPVAAELADLEPRLAEIDSPTVARMTAFARALVARDADRILRDVSGALADGQEARAVQLARLGIDALHRSKETKQESVAVSRLEAVAAGTASAQQLERVELTPRELEIAELVAAGLANPVIAQALFVSVRTVETHVNKLMKKIGAQHRQDIREYLLTVGS